MPLAIALHTLAAIVWVGGMFFAYVCLRPAAHALLEKPRYVELMVAVFGRFLAWVAAAAVLLPLTGFYVAMRAWGGMGAWPWHVHVMLALGVVMILVFLHLRLATYRRLREAQVTGDLAEAGRRIGQMRRLVALNLTLGLIVSAVAVAGRYV